MEKAGVFPTLARDGAGAGALWRVLTAGVVVEISHYLAARNP